MQTTLTNLSKQRWPWLLLAASALTLELCALFFQHVMKLEPCVMCVYERVAMLGILFSGLLGATAPQNTIVRSSGFLIWIISAVKGLLLALQHTDFQMNPSPFATCDFFPDFPTWAPLHEWFPWLFNPTGDCSEIVWQFFGYSMPQWLIVCFTIYCIIFIVVILGTFFTKK
ncbi:disulfide bond formation protein DsbB [Psychromonas sp. MME2]|uniref:disulfide bond formation protein DsbB n=1 Tax=unclassified Psychromonas TaxID=2614957 RepID=UPI00339C7529